MDCFLRNLCKTKEDGLEVVNQKTPLTSPSQDAIFKWLSTEKRNELKAEIPSLRGRPEYFKKVQFLAEVNQNVTLMIEDVRYKLQLMNGKNQTRILKMTYPERRIEKEVKTELGIPQLLENFVTTVLNRRGNSVKLLKIGCHYNILNYLKLSKLIVYSLNITSFSEMIDLSKLSHFRHLRELQLGGNEVSQKNCEDLMMLPPSVQVTLKLCSYPPHPYPPNARLEVTEESQTFEHFVWTLKKFIKECKTQGSFYRLCEFTDTSFQTINEFHDALEIEGAQRTNHCLSVGIGEGLQVNVYSTRQIGMIYGASGKVEFANC